MTVEELMGMLSDMPKDEPVYIVDDAGDLREIADVELASDDIVEYEGERSEIHLCGVRLHMKVGG